jgi:hypothetical protein
MPNVNSFLLIKSATDILLLNSFLDLRLLLIGEALAYDDESNDLLEFGLIWTEGADSEFIV